MRVFKRKSVFVSTLFVSIALGPNALAHDDFEIDLTGGYRFGSSIDVDALGDDGQIVSEGSLRFDGSFAFSVIAGYRIQKDGFIYLSYSRQQTSSTYSDEAASANDLSASASLEYYQFGGNIEMTRGPVVPYLGFSLGLARLAALGGGSSRVFFAPVLDSGFKVELHEHVHLRFLGRIPVLFAKGDIFCPSGGNCLRATKIRPMTQLELHAGLGVSF